MGFTFLRSQSILILAIAFLIVSSSSLVRGYSVYVTNDLDGVNLKLHCRSKDNDLGEQILTEDSDFHWHFGVNFFNTTLYYCDFEWQENDLTMVMHYDVFVTKRDALKNKCGFGDSPTCYWKVKNDGLYFKNFKTDVYELNYKWPQ